MNAASGNIGRFLARVFQPRKGLDSIRFPLGTPQAIRRTFVEEMNKLAGTSYETGTPYAVEILGGEATHRWIVHPKIAEEYRAGSRLFVWEEGSYDPTSGFASAVSMLLDRDFPAVAGPAGLLKRLAQEIVHDARQQNPDTLHPGDWQVLETTSRDVLHFVAEAMRVAGNESLETWCSAWWRFADKFAERLHKKIAKGDNLPAAHVLAYAAAGLPKPADPNGYQLLDPGKYFRALVANWSSTGDANNSCNVLRAMRGNSQYPAERLGIDLLDQFRNSLGHTVLAITSLVPSDSNEDATSVWANIKEEDWILLGDSRPEVASVLLGDSELPLLCELPRPTFLVPEVPKGEGLWQVSEQHIAREGLLIRFPIVAGTHAGKDSLALTCRPGGIDAEIQSILVESGICSVTVKLKISLKTKGKWPIKPVVVALVGVDDSGLAILGGNQLELALVFPPPARFASSVITIGKGKRKKIIVCERPEYTRRNDQIEPVSCKPETYSLNLEHSENVSTYSVLESGDATDAKLIAPEKQGVAASEWKSLLMIEDWIARDAEEIELACDGFSYTVLEVSLGEDFDRPWSPIAGAASGVAPRPMSEPPPGASGSSLRGTLETELKGLLERFSDNSVSPEEFGLGQAILPEGLRYSWASNGLKYSDGVPWMADVPAGARRLAHCGFGPSPELLSSEEASVFWQSACQIYLKIRSELSSGKAPWVSRCSLLPVGKELVDRYLEAYAALVNLGNSISASDGFWARYPFSFPVVDTRNGELKAILLSPLHPVRTAWLYSAEYAASTNFESDHPSDLLQVIEGWNFPWIGQAPAPAGNIAVLAAVPVDLGLERIFIGWSMLCAFNNSTGSALVAPTWAAGKHLPGSASSGLAEGGISAAMRDFSRVHPNLASLSIDLFSANPAPRSSATDSAIVSAISKLAISSNDSPPPLLGGIRVFDSLNRAGSPPISEETLSSANEYGTSPISWTRYNPEKPPLSHLRLVENSNATVSRVPGSRAGWMPPLPIKRFAGMTGERLEDINPTMHVNAKDSGWSSFVNALNAVEEPAAGSSDRESSASALKFQGGGAFFRGETTPRWTVTGNVQNSPAAIAREVSEQGQMLWEWRPGFLSTRSVSDSLGAQPYTVVASIPDAFRNALARQLNISSSAVEKIFSTLGSRGVGLASLMAMGTTHVSGALGFYLGYKLIDELVPPDELSARLVAPIDAVDGLLRSIIPGAGLDETKRADLLIVDLPLASDQPIVLRPVEIRCSPDGPASFPSLESNAVARKVEQLSQSISATKKAIHSARLGQGEAGEGSLLARCAIADVVQCAWLLTPGRHADEDIPAILARITAGAMSIDVGRSLVLWFQRTGERQVKFFEDAPQPEIGAAFIDIDLALEAPANDQVLKGLSGKIASWLARERPFPVEPDAKIKSTKSDASADKENVIDPEPGTPTSPSLGEHSQARSQEQVRHTARPVVEIGEDVSGSTIKWDPYHPAQRLTNSHMVVLGSSGSGKTQLLKSFVAQLSSQGVTPLLLDFNDDYIEHDYLSELGARCFDGLDGLPFNPLQPELDSYSGRLNIDKQVFQVSGVLAEVYGLGVQQEANLRAALKRAYQEAEIMEDQDSISGIPNFSRVGTLLEEEGDKTVLNRLSPIFQLELFRPDTLSLEELIRGPVIVRLSQLPNEDVKKAAAELILRSFYNSILHQGHSQSLRYVIVIDEAHKIANLGAVKTLLKEARKYGVSVVLSSQEARDFQDYVFANAGTLLSLKLSETNDSTRVARLLGGSREAANLAEKIRKLAPFEGILRNDHYNSPYAMVKVLPYFKMRSRNKNV